MFTECVVCGMTMMSGSICHVCEIGEEGGVVGIWQDPRGKILQWMRPEDHSSEIECDAIIPAEDFAELVRAQRKAEII